MADLQMITVKGADNDRVALWDKDPAYKKQIPDNDGEIMIKPNQVMTVPATAAVEQALAEKRLVRVDPSEAPTTGEPAPPAQTGKSKDKDK